MARQVRLWGAEGRAHDAIQRALKTGRLTRPTRCEVCGALGRTIAHHHKGYAPRYRLAVLWLCNSCHGYAHSQPRLFKAMRAASAGKKGTR